MTIEALLDTNICIYIARNRPPSVAQRFAERPAGSLGISVITWGELLTGAAKSQQSIKARSLLADFVSAVPVQAMSESVAQHYGDIRAVLELAGTPIGNNDLWIAAHTRALGLTLISNNVREFERVPGLKLENWV